MKNLSSPGNEIHKEWHNSRSFHPLDHCQTNLGISTISGVSDPLYKQLKWKKPEQQGSCS